MAVVTLRHDITTGGERRWLYADSVAPAGLHGDPAHQLGTGDKRVQLGHKDESGATAIEYGLIAALIAVGIITAARLLGTQISSTFNNVGNAMK